MGAGIAEVCARAGLQVIVREANEDLVEAGARKIFASMEKALERKKMTQEEMQTAIDALSFTTDLADLAEAELVIEAITEDETIKLQLFSDLDSMVNSDAVLASNTSSIPIGRLADATKRPEKVIGMHFFNPVPVMPILELISSEHTSPDTAKFAEDFAGHLKKTVVHAPDRAGFIVNALLIPYLLSAIRFLEAGLATKEDIDTGMELGCNLPMGPLKLCDFIGLDTIKFIADVLHHELHDPANHAPLLLNTMVAEGKLGKKSGEGFYTY
jgi:3-hydroxybutyryl-CoA dehydrogenase